MKKHSLDAANYIHCQSVGSRCNPALLGTEYDIAAALLHAQ